MSEALLSDELTGVPRTSEFGAGKAILTLLFIFAAQVAVGFVVGALKVIGAFRAGGNLGDPRTLEAIVRDIGSVTVILSMIVTVAITVLCARVWAWTETRDRSDNGIGLRRASSAQLLIAGVFGAALASTYVIVCRTFLPPPSGLPPGPVSRLATAGGIDAVVWILLALVLAPPVEEFLFRGLLLKGFSRSWGFPAGAAAVTVIFVLLHLFETLAYWPATVAILLLALATLAARILTGSLVPPLALHIAYNLAIVISGVLLLR